MRQVIATKEYGMTLQISRDLVFVELFEIHPKLRGKKLSYGIFLDLIRQYHRDIYLECFKTLIPYYEKLGFVNLGLCHCDGYYEMHLSTSKYYYLKSKVRKLRRK